MRIEVWTEEEWDALSEAERPPDDERTHLPGIGWIAIGAITSLAAKDLEDVIGQSLDAYQMRRGEAE